MAQKIEIPVSANTAGAESGLKKVDDVASSTAGSFDEIGAAAGAAGAKVDDLQRKTENLAKTAQKAAESTAGQIKYTADRLRQLQSQLERELGQPVSISDAHRAALNFETDRARGRMRGRVVRDSADFVEYLGVSGLAASNDAHRRRHRREVIASSMRGTAAAANGGAAPPEEPPPPGGGGEGGGGFQKGVQRTQSMALAFGKSMLALAGLNSIMGMASSAVEMATEEAVGIDTLKRRSGDLGVSFDKLQDQVRAAGDGMGITYVESVRLAQQLVKLTGQFENGKNLRTSEGFSRAFGLDPSEGVQFFGTMRRLKVAGADDQGSRRLALMIGEAVSKSGYGGKADELLAAVSNIADGLARATLSSPNVGDIAGYLTTLTKTGYPGLDPAGAAALLGAADNATRRGGGMGESGQNFLYGALTRYSPGMNVVQANALWAQGLFGTTKNTFGKNTPLGDLAAKDGLSVPKLDDVPNVTKMMDLMQRQYGGNEWFMLDAMKNLFGLQNPQQAAALLAMHRAGPENLSESQRLVTAAGVDLSKMSATGISGVGKVAAAKTPDELRALYRDVLGRKDVKLSGKEKSDLESAFSGNDIEKMKKSLAGFYATHEQEKTEGTETRQTISDLKNELTRVGGGLLNVLNPIRSAVEMMAQKIAPEAWRQQQQALKDKGVDFHEKTIADGVSEQHLQERYRQIERKYDQLGGGKKALDVVAPEPTYNDAEPGILGGGPTDYDMGMALHQHLSNYAKAKAVKLSKGDRASIIRAAGGDKDKAAFMESLLRVENRGFGFPKNSAVSSKGARGAWQFMPGTWKDFGQGTFNNAHHFFAGAQATSKFIDWIKKKYNTNDPDVIAAYYNGGDPAARAVLAGRPPPAAETQDYIGMVHGLSNAGTPMPDGGKSDQADRARTANMKVGFGDATITIKDHSGKEIGNTVLKPYVQQPAAGVGAH